MAESVEERRARGIKAIIYLQALIGIVETPEQAEKGWGRMNGNMQDFTLATYAEFKAAEKGE